MKYKQITAETQEANGTLSFTCQRK